MATVPSRRELFACTISAVLRGHRHVIFVKKRRLVFVLYCISTLRYMSTNAMRGYTATVRMVACSSGGNSRNQAETQL